MASSAIPMTRLGGRAFNHSPGNDAEAEYDRLRELARQEAAKRSSCFDRAHEAHERGDGAEAKALSEEGKRHAAQMDAYNRQASEYIFRENNAPGRVAGDTIDLHGQFVEEAERILEARIRDAQARGQTHLHVVVGRGNHSAGHVQKIKPAVERLCRDLGLHYATEENEGRVYVDLTGGEVGPAPPPLPQPQPGGGDYYTDASPRPQHHAEHGQQHHRPHQYQQGYQQGYQQEHRPPQQHQQPQQGDEIEEVVEQCLPKLFKGCCTVM